MSIYIADILLRLSALYLLGDKADNNFNVAAL
jgi:hypothetical protein